MKVFSRDKTNICRIIGVFTIMAITLFGVSQVIIQAKYYKNNKDNTRISANGFYFSSDYLNEIKNGEMSEYVMYGWNGKMKKSFAFKIRNYENPLLYNNEEQTVDYASNYEIDDEYADKVNVVLYKLTDEGYVESEKQGELTGGGSTFNYDEYKLSVEPKEGVEITNDVSVTIKVNTVNAPYYRELYTKVTLQYTEYTEFISSKQFTDIDADDYALKYTICTANEANLSEMENTNITTATKELDLHWDYRKLSLDRFDDRIGTAFETKKVGEDGITNENMSQYKNIIIIDEISGMAHIYFDALPFSEFNIYFYKEIGIDDEVWKDNADSSKYIWETDAKSLVNVVETE